MTRSIHDNFLYIKNLTTRLHKSKTLTLFLKLDIANAFDKVRWDYLLEPLQRLGFSSRWRDWLVALLLSASSRLLINGIPSGAITHNRGLQQGHPLSPFLFILAIDPLQCLFQFGHIHLPSTHRHYHNGPNTSKLREGLGVTGQLSQKHGGTYKL